MAGPVLIIEDDPDIAEVLVYSLEKATFNTRVATTGEEGLGFSGPCQSSLNNSARLVATGNERYGVVSPTTGGTIHFLNAYRSNHGQSL